MENECRHAWTLANWLLKVWKWYRFENTVGNFIQQITYVIQ